MIPLRAARTLAGCAIVASSALSMAGIHDADRRKLPLVAFFVILGWAGLSRLEIYEQ